MFSTERTLYSYSWTELLQEGGSGTIAPFDNTHLAEASWGLGSDDVPFELWVDQVGFCRSSAPTDAPVAGS